MKTEDLITALSQSLPPEPHTASPSPSFVLPILAGVIASIALVLLWLGPLDLAKAITLPAWRLKFGYALLLGLAGYSLAERASRPGARGERTFGLAAAILVGLMAVIGATEWLETPAIKRTALLTGVSWTVCVRNILAAAAPIYLGAVIAIRLRAPTRPALAGAAAGLLAGGMGATAYALHCPEIAPAFVAVWYTAGIAASTGLGALIGLRAMRW